MTKAEQINAALDKHAQALIRTGRLYNLDRVKFDAERIAIIEEILGGSVAGGSVAQSSPSTYKVSVTVVTRALMFMMETAMGDWAPGSRIDQHNEQFRAKIEGDLIKFAAEIRTQVHQEIASGAGAADELLRSVTK